LLDIDADPSLSAYLGTTSPTNTKTLKCPSDSFHFNGASFQNNGFKDQPWTDFSSYAFNGENTRTNPIKHRPYPGIAGKRLSDTANPAKTLLMLEAAARTPYSWHNPRLRNRDYRHNNSRNTVGYLDGHVEYVRMYWKGLGSEAWQYNPPLEYAYRWD
jgi:prepilin-type processing-associated H-X9-DG protein